MSILFPKVNKMPTWDYRPIYYDPEKEKREQRRRQLQAERETENAASKTAEKSASKTAEKSASKTAEKAASKTSESPSVAGQGEGEHYTTLHRGSFREARNLTPTGAQRTSRLAFWITLLGLLLFCFYFLL